MTLNVALDTGDTAVSGLHRTVLASLPARFRVTAGPSADVVLVSGSQPGWQGRAQAAAAAGAQAIMLAGTAALTASALRALAKESSITVAATPAYAIGRAWTSAVPLLAADIAGSAILDSAITRRIGNREAAALRAALTEQVAVIRTLLPGLEFGTAHAADRSYVLAGQARGIAVTLAGTLAESHRLDLDLVSTGRHWHASLFADALAFPASISLSDADGGHVLAPVYESAHRAAWAALHDAIRRDAPLAYTADQLADDLAAAEAVFGPART